MTDVRVGLLGLGTVNAAVARRLIGDAPLLAERAGRTISIAGAVVRHPETSRDVDLGGVPLSSDADALVGAESIDVIIEAIGGVDPARRLLAAALSSGKHVITANKAVIAAHGVELSGIAEKNGVSLLYSAAVGGGVPILELLGNALQGDRIVGVEAICNGTTNFILSRMTRDSMSFADALSEAQQLGFAEADSAYDVDGWDAVHKLSIIASTLWGARLDPDAVRRRGIADIDIVDLRHATDLGCAVKLLARATWDNGRVAASVQPTLLVLGHHPLAAIDGGENGFLVRGDLSGPVLLTGTGAGGDGTASAMVSDLVKIARGGDGGGTPFAPQVMAVAAADDAECAVYIRVVTNSSAAANEVAQMLEDRGVAVISMSDSGGHDVVLLTGPAPVAVVDRALETLDSMACVDRVAACLEVAGRI